MLAVEYVVKTRISETWQIKGQSYQPSPVHGLLAGLIHYGIMWSTSWKARHLEASGEGDAARKAGETPAGTGDRSFLLQKKSLCNRSCNTFLRECRSTLVIWRLPFWPHLMAAITTDTGLLGGSSPVPSSSFSFVLVQHFLSGRRTRVSWQKLILAWARKVYSPKHTLKKWKPGNAFSSFIIYSMEESRY